jgi:ribosome-associated protein
LTKGRANLRPQRTKPEAARALALRAAELAREKKGEDVALLDLTDLGAVSDYFLLVSASSEVQVKTIAEHIHDTLKREGSAPWHVEGLAHRRWVVLDFVDVVVHVFHEETRAYYLLERLWGDARRVALPEA